MLEAMACGTPVAAFPVDGPLTVLGRKNDAGRCLGGAMHEDLQQACFGAMGVSRHEARARALEFGWAHAALLFETFLVNAWQQQAPPSQRQIPVTKLSSHGPTLSPDRHTHTHAPSSNASAAPTAPCA